MQTERRRRPTPWKAGIIWFAVVVAALLWAAVYSVGAASTGVAKVAWGEAE